MLYIDQNSNSCLRFLPATGLIFMIACIAVK